MSIAEVVPINGSDALDRVVAAAKRIEEHEEVDRWEFADDVREAVDQRGESQNGFETQQRMGPAPKGFYAAIDEVTERLTEENIVSVGRQSIVGAYTTAKVWPPEDRVEGATYWAHHELRGRDYEGRRKRALERLVARSGTHRVGPKDVRLWKSSTRPSDMTPFIEKVDRRVRSAIKSAAAPWNGVAEGDRMEIARNLRRLADEIQADEFK